MRWRGLLFAHWPVEPDVLRPLVPAGLEIDTFGGRAYLGIVPFGMEDVAPRGLPAIPGLSAFPEVNVRTYVRHGSLDGIWFLSLDAASHVAVEGARTAFHLPYFYASTWMERHGADVVYHSERRDRRGPPAILDAWYRPTGPVAPAAPGSLEAWLTARFRLFAADGGGRLSRTEIRHATWPLQPAEGEVEADPLAAAHGLVLPDSTPHLLFSERLDVKAWWPRRVA